MDTAITDTPTRNAPNVVVTVNVYNFLNVLISSHNNTNYLYAKIKTRLDIHKIHLEDQVEK